MRFYQPGRAYAQPLPSSLTKFIKSQIGEALSYNWHSLPPPPYEERLQRLGLHSLQRRLLRANLITAFKIFTGLLDVDPKFSFLPYTHPGLRGHPYKVLQGASHRRRRGLWNIEISSRIPSFQHLLTTLSRKGWRKFGQKFFPIFPIDWNLITPII